MTGDKTQNVVREIPRYKNGSNKGDTIYWFKAIRQRANQLNLINLENGYDSLEIRIWLGHSLALKRNVVIISRRHNKWSGELVTFTVGHDEKSGEELVEKKQIKNVTPNSGWESLVTKLFSLKITTLPDETNLTGYNGCGADGLPYYFEVATMNKYRFFTYCNVEDNTQNFPEARYVHGTGRLLEQELNFKFTR
jgi:hypothetical protein